MGKELFGTDGIRGVAGEYPLDPATVYAFGVALGYDAMSAGASPEILIGTDTRESGPWIAGLVAGGLSSAGARVRYAGVITTPGVAYLTRAGAFVAGVMISASHNPYQDNGLKVFGHDGFKLPDAEEHTIEQEILRLRANGAVPRPATLTVDQELVRQYLEFLLSVSGTRLDGVKVALDCGHGAAYWLGPELFQRLGAAVAPLGCTPNGHNINLNCGALHVEGLREAVLANHADFGVAFDGDADRSIFVAKSGKIVNGDGVLLACGRALQASGHLSGATVVSTVMANLGLERALHRYGIRMVRTPVGDKYVLEEMVRLNAVLGGEQSGHIIFREYATTGDGMLTALRIFEIAASTGKSLDELCAGLEIYPQKLVNVRVKDRRPLDQMAAVNAEIAACNKAFDGSGRVLVRFSGTEPLARVMVEGPDLPRVEEYSQRIADAIRAEIG